MERTMTQNEKSILLKDLSARLPYNVKVNITYNKEHGSSDRLQICSEGCLILNTDVLGLCIEDEIYLKPYLRPMSSMGEEEKDELLNLLFDKEARNFYIDEEGLIDGKTSYLLKEGLNYPAFCPINIKLYTDFLLSHHFDYNGLIEKGLALVTPEGMYKV